MYRIKLASGEEAVYRSAGELALAVSSGVVSAQAEVFHKSAGRWLPIELHPDYRAVVTGRRQAITQPALNGEAPAPLPADLTDPRRQPGWMSAEDEVVEEYDPETDPTPVESEEPPPDRSPGRAQSLRLMLALAMGLGCLGLIGGGAYAAWRYLLPLLEQPRSEPQRTEGMPPEPAPPADSPFPTMYAASAPPLLPLTGERAPRESVVPDVRTSRLRATGNRTPGYSEGYADARAEMEEAFEYIHFQRVFAPSRFTAPESLRATRRMVAAAANILQVYRGREVMLEQSYRRDDPGGRGSFRESFETVEAARALLADADSLLGLLVAQQGRTAYDGQSVTFNDPHARAAYANLREMILAGLGEWRDSIEAPNLVTIPRILRALGSPTPPPPK